MQNVYMRSLLKQMGYATHTSRRVYWNKKKQIFIRVAKLMKILIRREESLPNDELGDGIKQINEVPLHHELCVCILFFQVFRVT